MILKQVLKLNPDLFLQYIFDCVTYFGQYPWSLQRLRLAGFNDSIHGLQYGHHHLSLSVLSHRLQKTRQNHLQQLMQSWRDIKRDTQELIKGFRVIKKNSHLTFTLIAAHLTKEVGGKETIGSEWMTDWLTGPWGALHQWRQRNLKVNLFVNWSSS